MTIKTYLILFLTGILVLFTFGFSSVQAKNDDDGDGRKVTICHATGSETNPFVRIVVNFHAIGGHFFNNGTPKSGHEDDILIRGIASCPVPPPTVDLCKNIRGIQTEIPEGYYQEGNKCFRVKIDMCPNIEGRQKEVPEGYVKDEGGNCVLEEDNEEQDLCTNLEGVQSTLPNDYLQGKNNFCVKRTHGGGGTVTKIEPQILGATTDLPKELPVGGGSESTMLWSLLAALGLSAVSAGLFNAVKALKA